MSDGEDGTVGKLRSNRTLNKRISLQVDGGSGLVQHENVGLSKQCPSQADQLTLAYVEVFAALRNGVRKPFPNKLINGFRWASSNICHNWSFVWWSKGSRFWQMVSQKRIGFWGMMVMRKRSVCRLVDKDKVDKNDCIYTKQKSF